MPTTPEGIIADIAEATTAGFRGSLIARGQARAIIWRDGILPPDSPNFDDRLSYDLNSYGYALLGLGLRLRELEGDAMQARVAFEQAATALEAVVAKGDPNESNRNFHFVMAAASYHLAHLSARAYSLLTIVENDENFSPLERALALLMRRDFTAFRASVFDYRASGTGSDASIAAALQAQTDQKEAADALVDGGDDLLFEALDTALIDTFFSAMSLYLLAIERGEKPLVDQAIERLEGSLSICAELNLLPQWWSHRVAIHLLTDLWSNTFHERVPLQPVGGEATDWQDLRELFIASLQAIRVRASANGDTVGDFGLTLDDHELGYAVAAVETGTVNRSAAILIQAGFNSRLAAIKAVTETGTNFQTGVELRQWLNSESVTAWSAQPNWPTPDTKDMWLAFTKSFAPAESLVWSDRRYWANVEWLGVQPAAGSPVQIHHMAGQPQILAPDGEFLGTVKAALNPGRVGLLRAQVAQEEGRIAIAYLGPADLSSE